MFMIKGHFYHLLSEPSFQAYTSIFPLKHKRRTWHHTQSITKSVSVLYVLSYFITLHRIRSRYVIEMWKKTLNEGWFHDVAFINQFSDWSSRWKEVVEKMQANQGSDNILSTYQFVKKIYIKFINSSKY